MAKINTKIHLTSEIKLTLTEKEARALHALTVYGFKSFTEMFYKNLGKSALEPYETGLADLFEQLKDLKPTFDYLDTKRKEL